MQTTYVSPHEIIDHGLELQLCIVIAQVSLDLALSAAEALFID